MKVISKSPDMLKLRSYPILTWIMGFVSAFLGLNITASFFMAMLHEIEQITNNLENSFYILVGSLIFIFLGFLFMLSPVVTCVFDKKVSLVTIKRQGLLGDLLNISRESPLEPQGVLEYLIKYLLDARMIYYPLNEVQEAVVETTDDGDTYRIELRLLSGEQVPLRSSYDSGKSGKEKAVEEINSWLSEAQHRQGGIVQRRDKRLQEVMVSAEVVHRQADSEREPLITASVTEVPVTASVVSPSIKPLSAKNPLDHLRLLWWTLVTPQQLKAYREQFGQTAERPIAIWLASTLLWLPFFLPFLAIGLKIVPLPHSESPFIATHYLWASGGLLIAWLLTGVFGRLFKRPSRSTGSTGESTDTTGGSSEASTSTTGGSSGETEDSSQTGSIKDAIITLILFPLLLGLMLLIILIILIILFGQAVIVSLSSVMIGSSHIFFLPFIVLLLIIALAFGFGGGAKSVLLKKLWFVLVGVLAGGLAGVLAGGMAGVLAGILAGVLAFRLAVELLAALGKAIEKSLETGHPSFVARGAFGLLVAAYGFLVWCSYLGGWRWWIPQ